MYSFKNESVYHSNQNIIIKDFYLWIIKFHGNKIIEEHLLI
jgi:hypothetical protein